MSKENNLSPTALIILDGFGLADFNNSGNAVTPKTAPNIFNYRSNFPSTKLKAHGKAVGLFEGQTGNSEAGHFNIGAGRVVKQDLVRISETIEDGRFFKNHAFEQGLYHVQKYDQAVHVMMLLTDEDSPHAKMEHLYALLDFFKQNDQQEVYLHLFTDGRDSPPHAALELLQNLKEEREGKEKIATIMGRFYGMDRNKNWDRTQKAYKAIIQAKAEYTAETAEEAIKQAYKRDETDEYISPTLITGKDRPRKVEANDVVYFMNARSDRARQISKAFVQDKFLEDNPGAFEREYMPENIRFVALTDFGPDLPGIFTAFPSPDIPNCLAKAIDDNRQQLYISETEKYAHITFFLNGGYPKPINGEDREVVKSDDVRSFADKPEMESKKITERIITCLDSKTYDFICVNYPNPDMVAHTGNISAAKEAVSIVDKQVKQIVEKVKRAGGTTVITADHGNAEKMGEDPNNPITEHTTNPAPFIIVNEELQGSVNMKEGKLPDVAPTLLEVMNLDTPEEMTGKVLFEKNN